MPAVISEPPSTDLLETLMERKVHAVFVAAYGFCGLDTAARTIGASGPELADLANRKRRTKTLAPQHALTVLPLPTCDQHGVGIPCDVDSFLRREFKAVAKAHAKIRGCRKIYIDLNGYGMEFPFEAARRIAAEVLVDAPNIDFIYFVPNHRLWAAHEGAKG